MYEIKNVYFLLRRLLCDPHIAIATSVNRLKSIMLLNSPIILSGFKFTYYSQNYSHILKIIPTKSSPF